MSTLPRAYVPWIDAQFHDDQGAPLVGGRIEFFVAGTSIHKRTWNTAVATPGTENSNPVILNTEGRAPNIFLDEGGYDVTISDGNDVLLFTLEGIEDIGLTFLSSLGVELATGATNVTNGYTVLATDLFVTVDSSGGATTINLPAVASHPQPLTIKNLGTNIVTLTPTGVEKIDGLSTFAIAAAASPVFPSVMLGNDGVSNWWKLN